MATENFIELVSLFRKSAFEYDIPKIFMIQEQLHAAIESQKVEIDRLNSLVESYRKKNISIPIPPDYLRNPIMKANVTRSSLDSFDILDAEPLEQKIIKCMRPWTSYSRRELAVMTGLETSCVAGRVNHLEKMGVVQVIGTTQYSITHRKVEAVALVTEPQRELFA
jgi:hypothetical protein